MTKKIQILDEKGEKKKEISTDIFEGKIREDLVQKIAEIEKAYSPYAPFYLAGNQTSASGNVRHTRHVWKSDRGKGLARVPKKRMARSGDRFTWVGAVIPGTRGGRRAHPPKILKKIKKVNKKEMILGLKSALIMAASEEKVKEKYSRLKKGKFELKLPLVIDSKILLLKTKEFISAIKKILGSAEAIGFQEKSIRAGIGRMRGRKYKKSAGALLVVGDKEGKKIKGMSVKKAKELKVLDLASNGARLTLFTEEAIKDIEKKLGEK